MKSRAMLLRSAHSANAVVDDIERAKASTDRLDRCLLKDVQGDARNAIGAAASDNLRWLMRWIVFLRVWLRAIMQASMAARSTLHAIGS